MTTATPRTDHEQVRLDLGGVPVPIIPPFSDVLLACDAVRLVHCNRAGVREEDRQLLPG